MKILCKLLLLNIILCSVGFSDLSARTLNKVNIDGNAYYIYEVKKGDTMFGLAHDNGWDLGILQKYNSEMISPLQKGMILYYPALENIRNQNEKSSVGLQEAYYQDYSRIPLRHSLKCGETPEAISKMYGIPLSDIKRLNPGMKENWKSGTVLTLAENDLSASQTGKMPKFHTVTEDETLTDIANNYSVSVEALMNNNPGLSGHHFLSGNVLKIPAKGTGLRMDTQEMIESGISGFRSYKVKKDDTWDEIALLNGISEETLTAANPGIKLKKNTYIGIPVIYNDTVTRKIIAKDPREATSEGIYEIYRDVHNLTPDGEKPEIKIALILDEPSSKKDAEYLRGFLAGIDHLKNGKAKVILRVIDGNRPSSESIAILDSLRPSLIISNAERSLPQWITEYGASHRTEIINTFDVKNDDYISNPYVIQLITPSEYFNEKVAEYIATNYKGYALVFVGDKDDNDALADALRQSWDPAKVRDRSVVDLTTLPLSANEKYLMYGYSVKKNEISEFLSAVESASERQPLAVVNVIGRPNWIVYTDALGDKFNTAGVMIPSRFHLDKNTRSVNEFITDYGNLYDRQLMKSFPSYGVAGYDSAVYFIQGLSESRGDFNSLSDSDDLLQSYYSLSRPTNWSGLINTGVFLLRHRPYGSVDKIILR